MRVIITGGTGYIGRRLAGELTGAGYEVIALSRNPGRASGMPGRRSLQDRFAHAAVVPLGAGLPVAVVSYHPSRQNTQTGRLTPEMFDLVWSRTRELLV